MVATWLVECVVKEKSERTGFPISEFLPNDNSLFCVWIGPRLSREKEANLIFYTLSYLGIIISICAVVVALKTSFWEG